MYGSEQEVLPSKLEGLPSFFQGGYHLTKFFVGVETLSPNANAKHTTFAITGMGGCTVLVVDRGYKKCN